MKIAFVTATRPHAGGMINCLNNFSYGVKKLGHSAEIISIFETSSQRKKRQKLDDFLGRILENKNWLNFLAWQTIKVIIFFRFLKNYCQKRYDFVYVTDILAANAIRPLEKIFRIPVILNPIDSVYSLLVSKKLAKPDSWLVRYIIDQEKKAYLKARAMLTNGLDMEIYLQKIANNDSPIPPIEIPITETVFYLDPQDGRRMRKKLNLENKFIVLYVGRLSPEKGIIYLLRAIPEIIKGESKTNIFIAVAGATGPEKENLINYIKNNQYENYARVLGYIEDEDMRGLYNMADVFCAPTVTFEGEVIEYLEPKSSRQKGKYTISTANTTVQEAMACGKPVISTDIAGSREIIKENIDGLLVPEKNPQAIAQAILKLKNDSRLREKLATEALDSVQERFLPTSVVQFLIDYYKIIFNK